MRVGVGVGVRAGVGIRVQVWVRVGALRQPTWLATDDSESDWSQRAISLAATTLGGVVAWHSRLPAKIKACDQSMVALKGSVG